MKNKIVIHKNTNYSKIIFKYLLALLPLVFYGLYKNGIILYLNKEINFIGMLKPLLFPTLGFIFGLLVNLIKEKKFNINLCVLNGLLVGMLVPLDTNIILFSIITFGLLYAYTLIEKKFKFNIACLIKILIILALIFVNKYNYANTMELASDYAYSFIDLLFGRQVGGVSTTSVVWIILGFIYLFTDYYYKKDIPIIAYLSYALVWVVTIFFNNDFNTILLNLIAATPIFAFVFIAPISEYSPASKNGKIIYAVLIGVISAILSIFINSFEAPLIAVLAISLLNDPIDNLLRQKITK